MAIGTADFGQAQMNAQATNRIDGSSGGYQQCSNCLIWHYGYHACGPVGVAWPLATLTVADVERVVAKALEDHAKKYLAIIEKLADALAGKK